MVRALLATLLVSIVLGGTAVTAVQDKAPAAKAAPAAVSVVNLNTATAVQIATLPGIGEKTAQRIIEYRDKNGGFKKVEELMNVKGLGEKTFLKLKPLLTVDEGKAAAK